MTVRRGVLLGLLLFDLWLLFLFRRTLIPPSTRLTDRAGLIPRPDIREYNKYLAWVERESGVDFRILLVPETGKRSTRA